MASTILIAAAFPVISGVSRSAAGQLALGVATETSAGQISGYFTTLSSNGNLVSSGFSPATFSVEPGQTYVVSVQDFGDYAFDHWKDTGSHSRDRSISIESATQIVAVYRNTNSPSPSPQPPPDPSGKFTLRIESVDPAGNPLEGYYATLSQSGAPISSGFTTVSFVVDGGSKYTVAVQDYGEFAFDHWKDSGSKLRERSISVSSDRTLTAVYRSLDGSPSPSPSPPPSSGQSELAVSTVTGTGEIAGYYTTLTGQGTVATGFSPATFTLKNGASYSLSVSDYGDYVFDHWKDTGAKARERSVSINSDTQLVAIFRNINGPAPDPTPNPPPGNSGGDIVKTKSGLVASDPLTNGNFDSQELDSNNPEGWYYYGSAPVQNAPVKYYEDTDQGLHLGVQALSAGQWAGFFAETPDLPATLYHAVLTIPYDSIPDNSFDTGLYVQTSNGLINYVTCAAMATPTGSTWAVVRTTGDFEQATEFQTLWSDSSANQPNTRDCTIITNGDNRLQVYLDHKLIYSSDSLNLQMPAPFNAFLEVQSSSPSQMLFGTYKDYYSTMGPSITVDNLAAGSTVKIVRSGSTITTASAGQAGKVSVDLGSFDFPLSASIKVYDSGNKLIASSDTMKIWGGDAYAIKAGASSSTVIHESLATQEHTTNHSYNKKAGTHRLPESAFGK